MAYKLWDKNKQHKSLVKIAETDFVISSLTLPATNFSDTLRPMLMPVICAKISETKPPRAQSKSELATQQSVAPKVVPN